ncbi:RNA-directed DNA polymerase, eukaryota, partial [Tanacetum coccineum]
AREFSYANAVNKAKPPNRFSVLDDPALVLDDSCGNDADLSRHVFGKVKDFNSINTFKLILDKEGFADINLSYLGDLVFMILVDCLVAVIDVSTIRFVWVVVVRGGVPLSAGLPQLVYLVLGNKWGRSLNIVEATGSSFSRKRLRIKTSLANNILVSFKIIFKGKTFRVRAKELFTWSPSFSDFNKTEYSSDEEPQAGDNTKPGMALHGVEGLVDESDEEAVSETLFESGSSSQNDVCVNDQNEALINDGKAQDVIQKSDDPFEIYDILNKPPVNNAVPDPSLSHPPGYTPKQLNSETPVENSCAREESPLLQEDASRADVAKDVGSNVSESVSEFSSNIPTRINSHGGSMLDMLDDIIKVGQSMGYVMEGLGHKTKKEWIKELNFKHRINFLAIQETKLECISDMDVKFMWGNSNFQYVTSDSLGNSGGILCVWEQSVFQKIGASVSDNFIAVYGTWLPTSTKILIIVIYAPQSYTLKRTLWEYISSLINRWDGETIVMGDFNAVRTEDERFGSVFNVLCARNFNQFISSSGLIDVKMEGYSFTWSLPSASKMSKLDRFLITNGILSVFPSLSAVCMDRHLSDHRPIVLKEVSSDYGPRWGGGPRRPFRMYHSWFSYEGFHAMVTQAWNSFPHNDSNNLICFKKKLQDLEKIIRGWIFQQNLSKKEMKASLLKQLVDIDKQLENGVKNREMLFESMEVSRRLHNLNQSDLNDAAQKAKVKWAIEGDENSKFFHGVINKKRAQLAIRGVFNNGTWCTDPNTVKESFVSHFASRFKQPISSRFKLNMMFNNRLTVDQVGDLDRFVSFDEIKAAVWDCGANKSPGPDGFTFEFFKHFWDLIGSDLSAAVQHFFETGIFLPKWPRFLITGNPTREFPISCGLKQGDPLAPLLFILVMESLHRSVSRAVNDGLFTGLHLPRFTVEALSHLFSPAQHSPIVTFLLGEWSDANLANLIKILKCFHLASGLKINVQKSQLMGVGVSEELIRHGASSIGCAVLTTPFRYLGVGESSVSFALNRALLLKWVWRFISQDGSLWYHVIRALYGTSIANHRSCSSSLLSLSSILS